MSTPGVSAAHPSTFLPAGVRPVRLPQGIAAPAEAVEKSVAVETRVAQIFARRALEAAPRETAVKPLAQSGQTRGSQLDTFA